MKNRLLIFAICFCGGALLLWASSLRKQAQWQNGDAPWRLAIKHQGKWGVVDKEGELIWNYTLEDQPYYWDGHFTIRKGDQSEYFDPWGEPLRLGVANLGGLYSEGMVSFVDPESEKVGYKDGSGRTVIAPRFEVGMPFHQGYAGVMVDGKLNFIDQKGGFRLKTHLEDIDHAFRWGDHLLIQQLGKAGCMDLKGKVVIVPEYDEVLPFSRGLSRIKIKRDYGFINTKGKVIVEPKYNHAFPFERDQTLVFGKDQSSFLIDTKGQVVESYEDKAYLPIHQGKEWLLFAGRGYRFGFMDRKGKVMIEAKFEQALPFHDGVALVQQEGKLALINRSGEVVAKLESGKPDRISGQSGYGPQYFTAHMEDWISYGSSKTNNPQYVGETFLRAMSKDDFATAARFATEKAQTTIEMIEKMKEEAEPSEKPITIGETTLNGKTAQLSYTEDGTEKHLDLIREQGLWKAAFSK